MLDFSYPDNMLADFEGPKGPSQPDDNLRVKLAGVAQSMALLHTLHYDVISNYHNVTRKRTLHRIFICKFWGLKRW